MKIEKYSKFKVNFKLQVDYYIEKIKGVNNKNPFQG
jgi:hypothetical protein